MKVKNIKLLALIISIMMVLSSFTVVITAAPATYSSTSNSGTRDEICVSLDGTSASTYYTGDYTFDNLITLSSGELKTALHNLMTDTHTYITSYDDCRDYAFQTDCEKNDTTHATTLYTSYSMTTSDWSPTWNCNREHVWPKSKGGSTTTNGGSDMHHIRPSQKSVNSSRGNKSYGESSGYYVPADNVKGDVARIILYVHVRWDSAWGATNVTSVFESVDILLKWCEMDPVDTWEMGRNEVVQSIQGNRNVFIDYPELAWLMYGKAVPENMITPSGSAYDGEIPVPPPSDDTPDTPDTPTTPGEIPEYLVFKNESKYVTDKIYNYTSSSGKTKTQLELTDSKDSAASFQLINNSDGTVSFKADSGYLYADGTNVKFVSDIEDNAKFVFEENGSGYFVKCAYATYSGKAQYLEIYSGYLTCYGMGTNTNIYTFTFEKSPNAPETPDNPSGSSNKLATFEFGENGGEAHADGADAGSTQVFTDGDYTLTMTDISKCYTGARDAKGNSCLKVGTSSKTGALSFTVPDDVYEVVLYIAQYKVKTSTVDINGTKYNINTASDNGEYTAITIDTSATKTVTLATVEGATRVMINTIEFIGATVQPDPTPDPTPDLEDTTEESTEESTEVTTEESTEETTEESTETPGEDVSGEQSTETNTEVNTEANTEEGTEIDSTEASPAETSPVETTPEATTSAETEKAPEKKGCGSTVVSGAVVISVLCVGLFATKKKKEE